MHDQITSKQILTQAKQFEYAMKDTTRNLAKAQRTMLMPNKLEITLRLGEYTRIDNYAREYPEYRRKVERTIHHPITQEMRNQHARALELLEELESNPYYVEASGYDCEPTYIEEPRARDETIYAETEQEWSDRTLALLANETRPEPNHPLQTIRDEINTSLLGHFTTPSPLANLTLKDTK